MSARAEPAAATRCDASHTLDALEPWALTAFCGDTGPPPPLEMGSARSAPSASPQVRAVLCAHAAHLHRSPWWPSTLGGARTHTRTAACAVRATPHDPCNAKHALVRIRPSRAAGATHARTQALLHPADFSRCGAFVSLPASSGLVTQPVWRHVSTSLPNRRSLFEAGGGPPAHPRLGLRPHIAAPHTTHACPLLATRIRAHTHARHVKMESSARLPTRAGLREHATAKSRSLFQMPPRCTRAGRMSRRDHISHALAAQPHTRSHVCLSFLSSCASRACPACHCGWTARSIARCNLLAAALHRTRSKAAGRTHWDAAAGHPAHARLVSVVAMAMHDDAPRNDDQDFLEWQWHVDSVMSSAGT